MILILDNAESILDPHGMDAQEIYAAVKELSQFSNVCLCITSRISTIPPSCETLNIPTLSMEAAHNTFCSIYKNSGQPGPVNSILEQLDFHPLSITLLATVAHHSKWDTNRLTREWERQRTGILHTQHDESLAITIELSLASPMFHELGPNARGLLEVIAFFPQGINENNLDWLFPTLSSRDNILDIFQILSLVYQSSGFVTMLAPLRDYLSPKNPAASPLLLRTKDCYFSRLSVTVSPGKPGFEEAQWIVSEDSNVEHLLDVFTSIDTNSLGVWAACSRFMQHLHWHKPRLVVLGPKIEGLPDDHPSKPECLLHLSTLFHSLGNSMEEKRLLTHALELQHGQGNNLLVAQTLRYIGDANRSLGHYNEGIEQTRKALEVYKQLNDIAGQASSWKDLSRLLHRDGQLDAAEEAVLQAINLSDGGDQFPVCASYRTLGNICHSRGEIEKAINHMETAIQIASSYNWHDQLFWCYYALAWVFFSEGRFHDAHHHTECAKSHATDNQFLLGRIMELQANFWLGECRYEAAKSEALGAVIAYEKIGATNDVEDCKAILQKIQEAELATSH